MEFQKTFELIEEGIRRVYDSARYRSYLDMMSHFTSYSMNNCILIFQQCPHATFVAGYRTWQKKFERNVRKGEKGIRILAPIRKTKTEEQADEGSPVRYRTISVFDVSQTEGKPMPSFMDETLEGTVEDYEEFIDLLEQVSPVPVRFQKLQGRAHGWYSDRERVIVLKEGMSELQTIKTLAHEVAHAIMHNEREMDPSLTRPRMEVEAESVAYIICRHFGLDTGDYSFAYLASYSGGAELQELKASMERIHTASAVIIRRMELIMDPETEKELLFQGGREEELIMSVSP